MIGHYRFRLNAFFGVSGLYLFAFFAWEGIAGAYLSLGLMFLAFLLNAREIWPAIRHDPVFLVFASFSAYLFLRAAWAAQEFPDTAAHQFELALDWAHLAFFIFVAWWLRADARRIGTVLFLALLGLVVGITRRQEWGQFSVLFDGARSGFGYGIPQMGLFSAAAVLGMLTLARRFWGSSERRGLFVLRVVVWAALLGLLTQVLIISQSRVSWMALLIVAPVLVGYHIRGWIKDRSAVSWTHVAPAVALAVVLLAGLILANFSTIRNRVLFEAGMVQALVAGETGRVPVLSPLGARFHLVQHGMHEWLKRPVFGWGPSTQVAEFAAKPLSDFGHLHNTYLEILARFGLVGALLLAVGVGLIVRSSVAAYRTGRLPQDYFLYLCGAFGLLAIWSAANFRLSADWRFYCILWGALAYAVRLQGERSPARSLGRQGHLEPINE